MLTKSSLGLDKAWSKIVCQAGIWAKRWPEESHQEMHMTGPRVHSERVINAGTLAPGSTRDLPSLLL